MKKSLQIARRRNTASAIFFLALCFTGVGNAADDYAALLAKASHSLDNFEKTHWVYTETIATNEGTFVGRHDGRLGDGLRWTLLSVDEREPTDEEREEYLAEKRKQVNDDGDSIADMVDIESLELLDESDARWLFAFTPIDDAKDGTNFLEHVNGELEITKPDPHISSIRLHSDEPFKPHFTVKIKEFLTHLRFGRVAGHAQVVPLEAYVKVKARALMVKGIDEESRVTYGDYEFVGGGDGE